jgi:hypothetical protein
MNRPLGTVLEEVAGRSTGIDPLAARARGDRMARRTRVRRVVSLTLAMAIVVAIVVAVALRPREQALDVVGGGTDTTPPSTRSVGPPAAVLAGDTGILVLGDDGLGGVVVIDLDHRRVVRRTVVGSAAGDQPHRFDVIGETILTGWGEIWGVDVRTATSRKIADGTIYLPGTDDDLWLADWSDGRIGSGTFSLSHVAVDGRVLQRVVSPTAFPTPDRNGNPYSFPDWGLGPNLLFETDDGIAAWDPQRDAIAWRARADGKNGRVLDARHGRAVWMADESKLHVVDERGVDRSLSVSVPPGSSVESARLSPDATRLAVSVKTEQADQTAATSLRIVDLADGHETRIGADIVAPAYSIGPFQWTPDGSQIFSIGYSYASTTTTVIRYVVGRDGWTSETIPVGGVTASALVDRAGAPGWLDAPDATAAGCPPLTAYSPGRVVPACRFPF